MSGVGQMEEEEVGGRGGEGGTQDGTDIRGCPPALSKRLSLHDAICTCRLRTYIHTYICNSSMWVGWAECIVLAASWIQ